MFKDFKLIYVFTVRSINESPVSAKEWIIFPLKARRELGAKFASEGVGANEIRPKKANRITNLNFIYFV